MRPFGLVKTVVEKGISGGPGKPPPYLCVGHLYFETVDGYEQAVAEHGERLRADSHNYTNVQPVRPTREILHYTGTPPRPLRPERRLPPAKRVAPPPSP